MPRIKTIKGLLLLAALVFSTALVATTHLLVSSFYERSVRQEALHDANTFAELTFNSMFQLMSTGWTRKQLEAFLQAIRESVHDTDRQIDIYRGSKVSALFGDIAQKEPDARVDQAFASGEAYRQEEGEAVRFLYPLRAQEVCLKCHVNAAAGDVLGVIDVRQTVAPMIQANTRRITLAFVPLVPVALLATLLMTMYIRRRLGQSINALAGDIQAVHKLADLKVLERRPVDLGFKEFDVVSREIGELTGRVRRIAVDKDMLEFEIRLLEKFILTSDVIKDWREYVNRLLLDIDAVMPAYALFSIFKIGEDTFDLEVFWRYRPSEATRFAFEGSLREAMRKTEYFETGYAVRIEHHVADNSRDLPALAAADIDLQTKSLLVEAPKIGGIVGIGMQAQGDVEPTRGLVIESVLSTLLNVVGSVKAIDKYTKDLEYYATRDPLTNLYNQRVFWELLDSEVTRSARHQHPFSLLVVDADNFKSVNDTYGHSFGDVYLQEVSTAMRRALRDDDMLARYGGDEFAIILPETDLAGAVQVAERILARIAELAVGAPDGGRVLGSVSIGMATYPEHAMAMKDLFLFADNMMYRAKSEGKNRLAVPKPEDVLEVFRTVGEKSMLILGAVEKKSALPFFQPIVDVRTGQVEALEVLSRIRLDDGQLLVADDFVAIAEQMGVMHKLDYILMEKALEAIDGTDYRGKVFLNMSPRALVLNDFVPETRRIASQFNIDPQRIVFEITERETIKNMALLERFINTLKNEGFQLAIDDFGSGFSSFHYVKRFPIDYLKIEGDFILGMKNSEKDRALVRSIVTLAQDLGIRTVAEYVEDADVLQCVRDKGIDFAQGYYIRRPKADLAEALKVNL